MHSAFSTIPGDNVLRFYRLAIPVTKSAYEEDLDSDYSNVLAESVPALDGCCDVELPGVNVGDVDVGFITAVRPMRGGIIRVEEIGGAAYTLTAISPELGGSFNVVGGVETSIISLLDVPVSERVYDLQGRVVKNPASGIYVVDGKKVMV